MSFKLLPAVISMSACILTLNQLASAKEPKKSFEKSVFSNFKSLPANRAAMEQSSQNVKAQFTRWAVTTDKLSGNFTDIFGAPVTFTGNDNPARAQACMTEKLARLGFVKQEWVLVSSPSARKADYVNYRQVINGHNVVFASLNFRFTKTGDLMRIQAKNYGRPSGNTAPVVSAKDAQNIASKDLTDMAITGNTVDPQWSWFPVPSSKGYTLHPAWHFTINGRVSGQVPFRLTGYVDAVTGELLYRTNEIKETSYDLTVKGVVYKWGTLHPATSEALPYLQLNIGVNTYYTDSAGYYTNAGLLLPASTDIPLVGKWSTVIDSPTGLIPLFTDAVATAGTTYTYPTSTPCSDRHINAYYHVNKVHNFMKGFFPAFTGMDSSLITNVDLTSGTCNAFYNGRSINFFAADAQCHSFAELGDVVYHEYGHGISDHFYTEVSGTTINNGALNEACSDIWALSITRQPVLAQNAFVTYGGFIRRYDMTPQVYPIDLQGFDPHKDGQIIAGTWWDVGQNIGSIDTMAKLFTDVYFDVPDGPNGSEGAVYQSILIDALMADDNNSNLFDGTPHYAQIVAAFAKHGIYLEGDATFLHHELRHQAAGVSIPVSATMYLTSNSFLHDVTMYYRVNGTGSWAPVTMSISGATISGSIPAQTAGSTVEYYFAIHDSLGNANAFFPITCNPAMSSMQTTIPYQFAVSVNNHDSVNFDGSVIGWGIGMNAGDDATDGLWQHGAPVANPYLTAWPAGDHTSGFGQCLITGAGDLGFLGQGVAGGTTTVSSPSFDVSGMQTPIVEYYRWFSNSQDFTTFKKDPWIVKIRDASNSAWVTVENTYQDDSAWRRRVFPVSQYLPSSPTHIQLKFFSSDSVYTNWEANGQGTTVGGLDDFYIHDKLDKSGVQPVSLMNVKIYPNPADEAVNITLQNAGTGTISLYDMEGRLLTGVTMVTGRNDYSLNTGSLAAGSYNLVIQTDAGIRSKKIIVSHQ